MHLGKWDCAKTNGLSVLVVQPNAGDTGDDWSLKAISGDGTKNVTILRLQGPDAKTVIQMHHDSLKNEFELLDMFFGD